jgi:predicted metalloprotease
MLIAITVGAKNRQVENSASRKPRMRHGSNEDRQEAFRRCQGEGRVRACTACSVYAM